MTLSSHTFLLQAEGPQLEFKHDLPSLQREHKTLVAFANTAGKRMLISVDDVRQVLDVADLWAEEERICIRHHSVSCELHKQIRCLLDMERICMTLSCKPKADCNANVSLP